MRNCPNLCPSKKRRKKKLCGVELIDFKGDEGRNNKTTFFWLVSTHQKNMSQIGNLPQIGVKIKNI